jgi:hypothetical protein
MPLAAADRARAGLAAASFLAIVFGAGTASADPQASAGLTIGGAVTNLRDSSSGAFTLGGRADVLFLRERGRDMAVGPYVEALTIGFDTFEAGGGAEWLVPIRDELPLVLSTGLFERRAPGVGWQPGAAAGLFFGSRSYNFHSWYGLAAGVFVQGRYGLGDSRQADVVIGLQLDLALVVAPFLFLYEAVTH